jgi:hypothetical protein
MDKIEIIKELHRRLDGSARINGDIKFSSYDGNPFLNLLPRVECADGFAMSVQASSTHYCSPRNSFGPWHAVEIGYPTAKVDAFMPYIDDEDSAPTDTVYGYVPIGLVADAIAELGGYALAKATA